MFQGNNMLAIKKSILIPEFSDSHSSQKIDAPGAEKELELILKALDLEFSLKGRKLYHNLEYNFPDDSDSPGPRATFIADYGIDGELNQKRIIKIDRQEIKSKRAKFHYENGCNTLNDFNVLVNLGPEAYRHHISPVLDYWSVVDEDGIRKDITVEKYFPGHKKWLDLLPGLKENPLTKREFDKLSADVLDALSFINTEKNVYHRDLSLRNIYVKLNREAKKGFLSDILGKITGKQKEDSNEAIVGDLANACYKSHPQPKPQVTLGAKQVADPLIVYTGDGLQKPYSDGADIFSVAKDFLEGLLGEVVMEIDQLDRSAKVLKTSFTREINLSKDGNIDKALYYSVLNESFKHIPKHARKYIPVLRKALSLDEKERYSSVDEFVSDWKYYSKMDFASRAKAGLKTAAAIALLTAAGYGAFSALNKPVEIDTFKVHSEWNKATQGVDNNYVNAKVDVWAWQSGKTFSDADRVFVKRGDKIAATITANFAAIAEKYRSYENFRGKAYIEGVTDTAICRIPVNNFFINAVEPGFIPDMPMVSYYTHIFDVIKIPKDALDGAVYNLVVELYPPADTLYNNVWDSDQQDYESGTRVLFEGKSNVLLRKKIPIVVSEDKYDENIGTRAALFNSYDHYPRDNVNFMSVSEEINYPILKKDLKYVIRVPELGVVFKDTIEPGFGNSKYINFDLPNGKEMKSITLQTIVCDGGKIISQSFTPLKRETMRWGPKEVDYTNSYDYEIPDTNFVNKIMRYSAEAERFIK